MTEQENTAGRVEWVGRVAENPEVQASMQKRAEIKSAMQRNAISGEKASLILKNSAPPTPTSLFCAMLHPVLQLHPYPINMNQTL